MHNWLKPKDSLKGIKGGRGVRGLHGMIDDSHKINSEMCIFCGNKRLCRSNIEPCSYINLIGVKGEEGIPGLKGSKGKQGIV